MCFVDDDDEVHDYYGVAIMTAITDHLADSVDVFVFPTLCVLRETARAWKVEHSLDNPNEQPSTEDTFKRKPWFMHPIRRELAVTSRFTDKNWGEDGDWLRPLWDKMRREVKVSGTPLYYYNWDDGKNTSKQEGQR